MLRLLKTSGRSPVAQVDGLKEEAIGKGRGCVVPLLHEALVFVTRSFAIVRLSFTGF